MSWDDVRELRRRGFDIGSHTRRHQNLANLEWEKAIVEIRDSRSEIKRQIGEAPNHFAWPFGGLEDFSESLSQAVRDAGYITGCSAVRGANTERASLVELRRDSLEPNWSLALVRFFVEGAYDWVKQQPLWTWIPGNRRREY